MESGRSGYDGSASAKPSSDRMLKKVSSGVLVREQSSTYPTMGKEPVSAGSGLDGWDVYACGLSLPAALPGKGARLGALGAGGCNSRPS
jgi:hypothetical protein